MPNLNVDYNQACRELDKLIQLLSKLTQVSPKYRKYIAEIVIIRSFDLLISIIMSIACKVACDTAYCNNTKPNLLVRGRSSNDALNKMRTHGRPQPRWNLSWTRASEIKENVKYVIHPTDHFIFTIDHHGTFIDEVRRVRNRITHNNKKSRETYRIVVRRYYGAYLNSVTPGSLLLTTRQAPTLIVQYLRKSRILIKELVKA